MEQGKDIVSVPETGESGAWSALCVLPTDTPLFDKQASVFTVEVRRHCWSCLTSWNSSTLDDFSWSNGAWYFFICKLWLMKAPSSLREAGSIPGPILILLSHKKSGEAGCGTANFWPGWCLGTECFKWSKDLSTVVDTIMRWHKCGNSALEAEVKSHLSYYIPLANQDNHSKVSATMTNFGSRSLCSRETSAPISHMQTDLVLGLGTTPFSFSEVSPRSQIPILTRDSSDQQGENYYGIVSSSGCGGCLLGLSAGNLQKNWVH